MLFRFFFRFHIRHKFTQICFCTFFAADVLGLAVGYFLGKTIPAGFFSWISFGIFSVFGALRLLEGFEEALAFCNRGRSLSIIFTSALCIALAFMTMLKLTRSSGAGTVKNEG